MCLCRRQGSTVVDVEIRLTNRETVSDPALVNLIDSVANDDGSVMAGYLNQGRGRAEQGGMNLLTFSDIVIERIPGKSFVNIITVSINEF